MPGAGATVTTPGSNEAVDQGCICPQIDNAYGQGIMGLGKAYYIVSGCPLHDPPIPMPECPVCKRCRLGSARVHLLAPQAEMFQEAPVMVYYCDLGHQFTERDLKPAKRARRAHA